ncbi:hypothetical protein FGG08_006896 [Glutinoglossum americanum]|uniref:ABC1 atypical kinase-like domain-containing protein n=1 Tax=Glutinoglossum americanum TaxID=1670608 RepID=A0A9P8HRS5_9PEZI|nr:hypothetical protein FGG08_006896 [Glutinoglossum americanum]
MAGKRLLDVAHLFNASRSVASKHAALRSHQLDAYAKTSTLASAVKSQADRITQTAKAASAFVPRLGENPGESGQQGRTAGTTVPGKEDPERAHLYKPSETNTVADAVPQGDLEAGQEWAGRYSLPDGIVPGFGINVPNQDKGVFHGRSQTEPQKTSLLQPNATAIGGEGSEHKPSPTPTIPEETLPNQAPDLEGINIDIFQNPRVAKILGGEAQGKGDPGSLISEVKNDTPLEQTEDVGNKSHDTLIQQTVKPVIEEGDTDIQRLAADIAKNTANVDSDLEFPRAYSSQNTNYQMHESRVPSSQLGRLWHYGGLATGMAFGAVSESIRRAAGGSGNSGSLILSGGNMERLVSKLSRMRGAALKLGQMISFQDSKMLPSPIQEVLQRVQDRADYMPAMQRDHVLASNLGTDWRDLFGTFDEVPMAAASIGQVHGATLKSTGQRVAVKVQYPGVANSIDSDLNNLSILLTASRLLPKGLYLEKTIANARTELAWECDYEREARCGKRFRELLKGQDVFVVPEIISEASGKQVLTMERMEGVAVTKVMNFDQGQKDWVGTQILRLCLREITEFRYMQTDPNWTNFLYNAATQKLELLDFGASREYPDEFITLYTHILSAAVKGDRTTCRNLSIRLGYLTGYETEAMLNAHISSILTLAEPFSESSPEVYNFRDQTITERVKSFIPVMIKERLAPPPEETYSLHRKLSGAFLLCARLGSRVRCREIFEEALHKAGAERGGVRSWGEEGGPQEAQKIGGGL